MVKINILGKTSIMKNFNTNVRNVKNIIYIMFSDLDKILQNTSVIFIHRYAKYN